MRQLKLFLGLWGLLCLCSCSELKTISVREKGKLVHQYQVIRKTKVQHGFEKFYFENGRVDGEFLYENGIHHGDFTYYYKENGKILQKGRYVNGKMEGLLISYYPSGILKEDVMLVNGVTEGPFREFSEEGILQAQGVYTTVDDVEDLEDGLLKLYNKDGLLARKMICREGVCCTIWTIEEGDVKPVNKLCESIINGN